MKLILVSLFITVFIAAIVLGYAIAFVYSEIIITTRKRFFISLIPIAGIILAMYNTYKRLPK